MCKWTCSCIATLSTTFSEGDASQPPSLAHTPFILSTVSEADARQPTSLAR